MNYLEMAIPGPQGMNPPKFDDSLFWLNDVDIYWYQLFDGLQREWIHHEGQNNTWTESETECFPTGENHLHQVALVDLLRWAQALQDVVRVQVVAKEEDLIVHPEKSTFGKLRRRKRRSAIHFDSVAICC